jgi:hypothetical protein
MTFLTTDLRIKLRLHTGESDSDLSDNDADMLLNQAYWELLDKFPFREKEREATSTLTTGVREHVGPTPFEYIMQISIADPSDNKRYVLDRMTVREYDELFDSDTDNYGRPEKYFRRNDGYVVWPTPDKTYNVFIHHKATLANLGTAQNPEIPRSWHEIILFGAVWRRLTELGDHIRARELLNLQRTLVNSLPPTESKEEDSQRAGVSVPTELTEANWRR